LARMTYGSRAGRVRKRSVPGDTPSRSAEEVVRDLKKAAERAPGEDYRERSLAIHGLICARCGREFDQRNRHLLTVHHRDGDHHNNPPDGSNWENLCVYCHDDAHSRGVLGGYVEGAEPKDERRLAYRDDEQGSQPSSLEILMREAMARRKGKK
jgi:hypothetical protein